MAFGNNAYDMLQAEQQARAEQLAALGANPNMRRAGAVMGDLGSVANTVYRAFDPVNPIVAGREMYESGARFKDSVGDLAKVSGAQAGGFLANVGRQYGNRIDQQAGLNTPQRQMVPVPSRQQILNPAPALSPQPDALSGPAFAPASLSAMPQGAMAAEAQQRATPATRSRNTAAAPPMPPIPQERQASLAQAMASPETLQAVAEAGSGRGGKSEPIKKRGGFSPENMGMIAFGLTLMTGGDMNEALNAGLTVHGNLDGMRDEKEQKAASQELLKNVPKEYVPALNALIASKQFDKVADYSLSIQEEQAATEAANAQRSGLVSQAAGVLGVSPEAISMMPADKLSQMMVNRFDNQGTMQINAQKAQIEASKQAALEGDQTAGIEFLAAYGVDATNLPEKAINKQIEKLSVGQFSQGESNAAGHAYIMASVIPRLEYLEDNEWDPLTGFETNRSAQAEYSQLMNELALAINRKDSGAAISKPEMDEVRALYGFKRKLKGGAAAANAAAQKQRRNKYEAIKGQAGLALPYMMVNNPIMYDDDVLAGGVSLGVDTGFTPTAYSANPLGIEFEGVE
jgi:hypothetical protein